MKEETHDTLLEDSQEAAVVPTTELEDLSASDIVIPEDSTQRKQRIHELKEQIEETLARQQKIKGMQEVYKDVTDEALTDADRAIKQTPVGHLQKELSLLEQKQKGTVGGVRGALKKVGAFFSF